MMTSVLQVPVLEIWMRCAQISPTNYPFRLVLISFYPLASLWVFLALSRQPSHVPRLACTCFCKRCVVSCMHAFLVSVNGSRISLCLTFYTWLFFRSTVGVVCGWRLLCGTPWCHLQNVPAHCPSGGHNPSPTTTRGSILIHVSLWAEVRILSGSPAHT